MQVCYCVSRSQSAVFTDVVFNRMKLIRVLIVSERQSTRHGNEENRQGQPFQENCVIRQGEKMETFLTTLRPFRSHFTSGLSQTNRLFISERLSKMCEKEIFFQIISAER